MDISKVSGAWNFAFRSRSNIGHFLHHAWPEHSYTPLDASKPHKHTYSSFICSQTPPPGISGQIRTTADTIRLQQTPNDTNRLPQKPKKAVQGCAAVRVDMEWRLLVSWRMVCILFSRAVAVSWSYEISSSVSISWEGFGFWTK